MSIKDYEPTQDVRNSIAKFETLDAQARSAAEELYSKYQTEIDQLNNLIESRNVALDESNKLLRSEVTRLDGDKFKTVKFHAFQVSKKKGSDFYGAAEFVDKAKAEGVKKKMEDEGVIATKIEINYDAAKEFLKKNGLEKSFAGALHEGADLTPAVSGPKPLALFAQEIKGK